MQDSGVWNGDCNHYVSGVMVYNMLVLIISRMVSACSETFLHSL